jgi:hypothetical protein
MRALSTHSLLSRAGLLVLLAALASAATAQQIYQWKDANGVTHYSDNPPPSSQKAQNRRIDNRGAVVIEAAAAAAEDPQCTIARSNLALLSGKGAVQQDTDGDGKPDTNLDEQGRANQRNLAEASVKAYCKPAPAVTAAGG